MDERVSSLLTELPSSLKVAMRLVGPEINGMDYMTNERLDNIQSKDIFNKLVSQWMHKNIVSVIIGGEVDKSTTKRREGRP